MRILCKIKAGSHLFGTNTPESDTDYKGIFLPDPKELLMGKVEDTINTSTGSDREKNTSTDVDTEMWSLKKFMEMIYSSNNAALEILFAPKEMIVMSSPEWELLRSSKDELVCSKVKDYIRYCKGQAAKYGIKGTRVNSVKSALDATIELMTIDNISKYQMGDKLEFYWEGLKARLEGISHIMFIDNPVDRKEQPYLEINNRKFQKTVKIGYMYGALKKIHENYGNRAKQAAANEGIDWKAISHAYRCGAQAYELLNHGTITLPLVGDVRDYVLALKNNKNNLTIPFEEVRPKLELLADNLEIAARASKLRKEVAPKWMNYVFETYLNEIVTYQRERILS